MAILDSLAAGLRGLGMTLSPGVFQAGVAEDQRMQQTAELRKNAILAQVIKGVESGAIPQEKAGPLLAQFGMPANMVGPTPETLARTQAVQEEAAFRQKAAALDRSSPTFYDDVAHLALQHGKQDVAANMIKAKEQRLATMTTAANALAERVRHNDQQYEIAMQRLGDKKEYEAERNRLTELFQGQRNELLREGNEIKRLMTEMGGREPAKEIYDPNSPTGRAWFAPGKQIHGQPAPASAAFTRDADKQAQRNVQLNTALSAIGDLEQMVEANPRSTVGMGAPLVKGFENLANAIAPGSVESQASQAEVSKQTLVKTLSAITGSLAKESNKDVARLETALGLINTGTQDSMKKGLTIWKGVIKDIQSKEGSASGYVEIRTAQDGRKIGRKADGTFEVIQ